MCSDKGTCHSFGDDESHRRSALKVNQSSAIQSIE